MLKPKEAFIIGIFSKPNDHGFSGICKNYHNCYFFPYAQKPGEVASAFLIVDKKTGSVYPFDPSFDMMEFCSLPDAWTFDTNSINVAVKKASDMLGKM